MTPKTDEKTLLIRMILRTILWMRARPGEARYLRKTAAVLMLLSLLCALLCVPALAYDKLEKGMEGQDVLNMQLALKSLGYSIDTDGKYGAATVRVVKSFQRQHRLAQDGVAGNQTLTLLYSLAPAYAPGNGTAPTAIPYITPPPAAAPSTAAGTATVITTGGSLNLREGASSSAKTILTIPNGDMVIVVNRASTWTSVIYNGNAGYVMTAYLSFAQGAPTAVPAVPAVTAVPTAAPTAAPSGPVIQALVVTSGGTLNLRENPDASARILLEIPNSAWLTVTSRGSQWSAVIYNGAYGYVMSSFLSFGASLPNAIPTAFPTYLPTWAPTAAPTQNPSIFGEKAYVSTAGGSLNLREAANGTAKVVTTIPNGAEITILSRGSLWCAASYNGYAGYVMTSFLRFPVGTSTAAPTAAPTQAPSVSGTSAYVTTSGGSLNLREYARTNAKVLTTIPNGTLLSISSRGSVWCGTAYNGFAGYVMTSFLSFPGDPVIVPSAQPTAAPTPVPGGNTALGTALVTTSGGSVNLRADASSGARVIASVPNAGIVTVYSRGSTWCAVSYNGTNGYIMTQYLTFLSGSVPVTDTDAEDEDPSAYTRTLKKGMTGADVTWVQHRLQDLGYTVNVTNVYDDATFNAVKAFQTQNGLTADGLAGSQTFAILKSDSARKAGDAKLTYSTLRIDHSGDGVRQVQTDLKALGYNVTVNGSYDVATHNAVVAFQQRNGLVISGIADSLTRQVLHGGSGKPYSTPVTELPANEGWIQGPAISDLKLLHWQNEIKPSVKAGQTFTIFDPNTHLSWKLVFYSLGRHADSQPASWRDTQIMNRSFGSTSWTIHPVYVLLPSGQWTLATMHNRPHLYGTITDNGFGGHLCVHFLRDMAEAQKNDPNYGVNNQVTLRNAWKALTGETVN